MPDGVGAWFITFRNHTGNIQSRQCSRNGLRAEAERDKSRPYAVRDFPFFRRVANAKFRGFFVRPRSRTSGKREKLHFRGLGWAKNAKNSVSEASDEWKMRKMTFRPRRKCKKRQNLRFRHGGSIFSNQFYFLPLWSALMAIKCVAICQRAIESTTPTAWIYLFDLDRIVHLSARQHASTPRVAWFITFRFSVESIAREVCVIVRFPGVSEREESRSLG